MYTVNSLLFGLVATLAAAGNVEAHNLHPRHINHARGVNGTVPSSVPSSSSVTPTPLHSSTPSSSVASSTPLISSIPLSSSGAGATQSAPGSTTDLTVTYTLGTGTSTSVVTTTIHRTATDYHTITASEVPGAGAQNQQQQETTTVESTSTSTLTLTVRPTDTVTAQGTGIDGNGCNAATVTVTATETVTVNAGPTGAASQNHQQTSGDDSENEHHGHHGHHGHGGEPTVTESSSTTPLVTVTSRPFGNGTHTIPPFSGSSSFVTSSARVSSTKPATSSGSFSAFPTNFRRRYI